MKTPAGKVRCAIYTRKSSDEGLEQSFNSLDAQRAACAAYVASQTSEGWHELPTLYDDGGLSGGTLERPALQRLLADIAAGLVDIVVVYKVDRLSRSLLDFAKLVEAFDKASVSFVSITQSFNTTTSMGRLTLNMLLSFAQFEREVTAERIRDKIAASKARGMWMGGTAPLGYRPDGRSLAIVEEHAALVRHIFDRYLVLGNVRLLADELRREGIAVPQRMTASGRPLGGGWFSRGLLHEMLRRVTYLGQIPHRGKIYDGNHPAIVDTDTFARVQAMLAAHVQGKRGAPRSERPSALAGRVCDEAGEPLISTHASKGAKRYRYYVSRALHHRTSDSGMRFPAKEIETLVATQLGAVFADPFALAARAGLALAPVALERFMAGCAELASFLDERGLSAVVHMVSAVRVATDHVAIELDPAQLATLMGSDLDANTSAAVTIQVAARLKQSGLAMKLVLPSGGTAAAVTDAVAIRQLVTARRWWAELRRGELDITRLAAIEKVTPSYMTRVLRLAFLAPAVVDALLTGTQRAGVNIGALMRNGAIPADWAAQQASLLPS